MFFYRIRVAIIGLLFLFGSGCGPVEKDEREVDAQIMHGAAVVDVTFSADGRALASAGVDDVVRVLDVTDYLVNFELGEYASLLPKELPISPILGNGTGFSAVAFTPSGSEIAAAGVDFGLGDNIKFWDIDLKTRTSTFSSFVGKVNTIAIHPDGQQLAVGTGDIFDNGRLSIINVETGVETVIAQEFMGPVHQVVFSKDGMLLAAAWEDDTIRVWQTTSGILRNELKTPGHTPYSLTFSPNAETLVSTGDDSDPSFLGKGGVIHFWDMETGLLERSMPLTNLPLRTVAYSPTGALLAAGGDNHYVFLIDPVMATLQYTLRGHTDTINRVAFAPNGQLLASAGADHFLRLWYTGDIIGDTCGDGIDNDKDGWIDAKDPDCVSGKREVGFGSTQCNDGEDNDDDSAIDAADLDCASGFDDNEGSEDQNDTETESETSDTSSDADTESATEDDFLDGGNNDDENDGGLDVGF